MCLSQKIFSKIIEGHFNTYIIQSHVCVYIHVYILYLIYILYLLYKSVYHIYAFAVKSMTLTHGFCIIALFNSFQFVCRNSSHTHLFLMLFFLYTILVSIFLITKTRVSTGQFDIAKYQVQQNQESIVYWDGFAKAILVNQHMHKKTSAQTVIHYAFNV